MRSRLGYQSIVVLNARLGEIREIQSDIASCQTSSCKYLRPMVWENPISFSMSSTPKSRRQPLRLPMASRVPERWPAWEHEFCWLCCAAACPLGLAKRCRARRGHSRGRRDHSATQRLAWPHDVSAPRAAAMGPHRQRRVAYCPHISSRGCWRSAERRESAADAGRLFE